MSLWLYYAFHSTVNQIKKLFKTWVAILLLCCFGVGLIIGVGAAVIAELISDEIDESETGEYTEQTEEPDEEYTEYEGDEDDDDIAFTIKDPKTGDAILDVRTVTIVDLLVTLVVGGVIFSMILTADKTSIFLPADTVLLFTSPMKPQNVLMFRLASTMGTSLLLAVYIMFAWSGISTNFENPWLGLIAIAFVYASFLVQGTLLKSVAYIYCAGDKKKKNIVNYTVYALFVLIILGFGIYTSLSDCSNLAVNAINYVSHPISRWIPVIGWLKSVALYAVESNVPMVLLFIGINILFTAGLLVLLYCMKADYYEPALAKSEEFANTQAAILEQRSATKKLSKKQENKREKIRKEGIGRGSGASVIFWKEMYNRFRFAKFGIFTKTFETYAIFSIAIVGFLAYKGIYMLLPGAGIIAGISFFRALGNPIQKDATVHYFAMIPEKASKKLWYSFLAGTVSTAMDAIIPLVVCGIIAKASVLEILLWLLVIMTMDFYSSTVTAFISLSTPKNMANSFRQVILILFIYFGIAPAAAAIGVSYFLGPIEVGLAIASGINAAVGAIFFAFLPLFF